jgi:uncharacterized membrane protein (UPF0127 family)
MVAECADIADTSETRRTGLLRHSGLQPGEGLWIVPCEGVHTFGMKFAIDILFLSKKKKGQTRVKVLKVKRAVPKRRLAMSLLAASVLELPAGRAQATQTEPGDELDLESY